MAYGYLRRFLLVFFGGVFFVLSKGHAQSIDNVQVEVDGDNINVSFDLGYKSSIQEKYDIEIYSSRDNYSKPLVVKEGQLKDVPAMNRRITYVLDGMENFAEFKGEVDFQIIATMVYAPIVIDRPYQSEKYKRGSMVQVKWHGGIENETFNVDLYKDGVKMQTLDQNNEFGSYSWMMPKQQKKGNYKIAIQSEKNSLNRVLSPEFKVKARVPFIVKFLPVLAAGAAAYYVFGMQGGETGGGGGGDVNTLPDPPSLP